MSLTAKILANVPKIRHFSSSKRNFSKGIIVFNRSKVPSPPSVPNVQGVSERVVKVPNEPVGPGASKDGNYPNPEYFCYDKTSYFEAEVEMLKYRCPQPSAFKYYEAPK
ncbi:unnamed protein product [Ceutorhynchus assimilis]|uniref:NADH dehydrogenase [ubiquinone] flavoprotein 3, mitochondrial n=1 Tax=Ceutorhynchus assimilis TaxID=467358 RepID=A0A9N9MFA2_9CUCU|nr:unnamed protein product [Ceutorhynchus assimilis]